MARQPIPLRKVTLIAKWSPEILADLLIKDFCDGGSYLLTAYEWVVNNPARIVSPDTMQETLRGLDTAPDKHSKIAKFPATFFVWWDELEAAFHEYHQTVSSLDDLSAHDALDPDPATGPYQDLLDECPDYSSNPYLTVGTPTTRIELRKQQTAARHARWKAKAEELHREHPHQSKNWIAERISREPIAEGAKRETIRRNICIKKR